MCDDRAFYDHRPPIPRNTAEDLPLVRGRKLNGIAASSAAGMLAMRTFRSYEVGN
jgi:hypothetical protein